MIQLRSLMTVHVFQCFFDYRNYTEHVTRYHGGIRRKCNFEGCQEVGMTVEGFVKHYVSHGSAEFEFPAKHTEKLKTLIPCPLCSMSIRGMWKFYEHAFTHDPQPRFKCSVCGKATNKVQNFKDHLLKHNPNVLEYGE